MAIPLENLPDTILYYKRKITETNNEYEEPVVMKNVLLQLKKHNKQNYKTLDNREVFISNTLLFIDKENSKPFIIPQIEDKIVFDDEDFLVDMLIKERDPYTGKLHHLEIELR